MTRYIDGDQFSGETLLHLEHLGRVYDPGFLVGLI